MWLQPVRSMWQSGLCMLQCSWWARVGLCWCFYYYYGLVNLALACNQKVPAQQALRASSLARTAEPYLHTPRRACVCVCQPPCCTHQRVECGIVAACGGSVVGIMAVQLHESCSCMPQPACCVASQQWSDKPVFARCMCCVSLLWLFIPPFGAHVMAALVCLVQTDGPTCLFWQHTLVWVFCSTSALTLTVAMPTDLGCSIALMQLATASHCGSAAVWCGCRSLSGAGPGPSRQ